MKCPMGKGREGLSYTCTRFLGTISLSSPTSALPVALTRFSPFAVSGRSEVPVCRPFRDHSVSPWRTIKQRGVIVVLCEVTCGLSEVRLFWSFRESALHQPRGFLIASCRAAISSYREPGYSLRVRVRVWVWVTASYRWLQVGTGGYR